MPKTYSKNRKYRSKYRSKRYKNRQQLLSISTVKAIAKKAVEAHPEVKYRTTANTKCIVEHPLGPPSVAPTAVSGCKPLVETMLNATTIPLGTGNGQRIGDKIFLKGFRIKAEIKKPINLNPDPALAHQGLDFVKVFLMIIKSKNAPALAGNFAETWWEESWQTKATTKNKYNIIYKKEITINLVRSKFGQEIAVWNTTAATAANPGLGALQFNHTVQNNSTHSSKPILINHFCPVNQKTLVGQSAAGDIPFSYFFCAYAIPEKAGIGGDGYFNGEYVNGGNYDDIYTPKLNYQITTHYTDS